MRHFDFNGFIHLSCLVLSDGVTLDPCARARCVPCVVNHGNSPGEKQSQARTDVYTSLLEEFCGIQSV